MFCTACGTSNPSDALFCAACGRQIEQRPPALIDAPIEEVDAASSTEPDNAAQARPAVPPPTAAPPPPQYAPAPIHMTQQVQVTAPVLVAQPKSVALALVLTFFFGPLGLFYSSVTGGLIMLIGGVILSLVTFGVAAPFVWIGSMVWGAIAASNANSAASAIPPVQINRSQLP